MLPVTMGSLPINGEAGFSSELTRPTNNATTSESSQNPAMEQAMETTIPPGAILLTYTQARQRLGGEGKSAFHNRLKHDPKFPRPVYLSEREPRIFAHELDAWLAELAATREGDDHASS
jgi:hypothetical protein